MNNFSAHTIEGVLSAIVGPQASQSLTLVYHDLTTLAKADHAELVQLPHVGAYKASQVQAALELASRLTREVLGEAPLLDTPDRVADLLREETKQYTTETFQVLLLNTRRRLIKSYRVATGTLDTLLVHAREVFKPAIAANAAAVILSHNHPSGDPTPSEADIKVTRDMIRAGQLLRIEVLDHVILGQRTTERPRDYVSLRELGYFYA